MRLLKFDRLNELSLTGDLPNSIHSYAILSHTWGADKDEVTFNDLLNGPNKQTAGYAKIRFCGEQARRDGLQYFWVDTCCIDKANHTELSEAITSMFRWYQDADKCYVYLSDVSLRDEDDNYTKETWNLAFRKSRWFTRGWTLQELLAPTSVEFFSREGERLGDKNTLEQQIHEITGIPISALRGTPLSQFSVYERMRWAAKRDTKKEEDKAYCLLGMFDVFMPLIYGEGENAFIRLQKKIDKLPRTTSSGSANMHWVVPHPFNTLFTGRKDILGDLERSVRTAVQYSPCPDQCRMVVTGIGGQGKSEICLQLAQRVRSILWGVFWVDVSTPSIAENGFLDIANRLEISASTWEAGRQGLANIQRPWMLLLDNADDPNVDYQTYFPSGSSGVVVVTSRNLECKQYATADFVALEGLPIDEAKELLLKAADVTNDGRPLLEDDARGVATLLQSHPLALIQAGAYVARGHCTLAEYPKVYNHQRKRLLGFRPSQAQSRYRDVYATFEASVEILQVSRTQPTRDALELLPILAVCGPAQLPLFVFEAAWKGAQRIVASQSTDETDLRLTRWHVSRLPSLIQANGDVWDSFRLVEAVNMLRAFALVSTNVQNGQTSVSMHPLVHAWARDRQDEQRQHESWIAMGCVVAVSRSGGDIWRVHARQLQPHLQAITSWEMGCAFRSESKVTVAGIIKACGWLLHHMSDDSTLSMLLDRLCSHLGLYKFTVDQRWVALYHLIGRNLLDCGKVREAVRLLEEVVRIREQTLAEDHRDRRASQYELATAYEANGQIKDAVRLIEEVVRIEEQILTEDDPSRLASQHELAMIYKANGQVKDAVRLLEEVVRIQEQILVEDHRDRLTSQHSLAMVYKANGQVKDAVRLLEKVVQIREQILAEDHPDRLASQYELAGAYQANGQVKDAVRLLGKVVQIREQILAEDHPDRLTSQHELARAYQANGQVKDAVRMLEEVVRIEEQTLAEDHPDRLISQHSLASTLWKLGQHSAALKMMGHVVEIRQRVLNYNHPDRINSEGWLKFFEDNISQYGLTS